MVKLLGNVFDHEVKDTGIRTALDLIIYLALKNIPGRTSILKFSKLDYHAMEYCNTGRMIYAYKDTSMLIRKTRTDRIATNCRVHTSGQ